MKQIDESHASQAHLTATSAPASEAPRFVRDRCDGRLNLAAITKEPLKYAGFAFLSVCQTALGHKELPEEAIHLAAGMIMAGYPTVIGTMWSIRDSLAPVVAAQVYARLLRDGVPSTEQAAEALHEAVAYLRSEVGDNRFEDWAPFIHIGV